MISHGEEKTKKEKRRKKKKKKEKNAKRARRSLHDDLADSDFENFRKQGRWREQMREEWEKIGARTVKQCCKKVEDRCWLASKLGSGKNKKKKKKKKKKTS